MIYIHLYETLKKLRKGDNYDDDYSIERTTVNACGHDRMYRFGINFVKVLKRKGFANSAEPSIFRIIYKSYYEVKDTLKRLINTSNKEDNYYVEHF